MTPPPKIMIGMPIYRSIAPETFLSIIRTIYEVPLDVRIETWTNTPVEIARAELVRVFLESDRTHLLFVDADSGFAPDIVRRLVAADRPVCAVAFPGRRLPIAFPIAVEPGTTLAADESGIASCAAIGFGMVCIRRDVLERMVAAYPELLVSAHRAPGKKTSMLFASLIEGGHCFGEDFSFCLRWRRVHERDGGPPGVINVLVDAEVEHLGTLAFRGNLADALRGT